MLRDAYAECRQVLEQSGIEAPEYEARALVEFVTGLCRASQIANADRALSVDEQTRLKELTERRAGHVPLQYLLGSWSFYGFELEVGEGVLIPRDDTEVAVNLCISYLKSISKPARVIDLCSGSGAIAVTLSNLCGAEIAAVELSGKAYRFLEKNIKKHNAWVIPVKGDIFTCHKDFSDGMYDLIVSNPPYIKTAEIAALQAEVQREPAMALDGGVDGYDFYRSIVKEWSGKLKKGGALVFELGENQADYVARLMEKQGFCDIRKELDLGGTQRAIIGTML